MKNPINRIVCPDLVLGRVFGMVGSIAAAANFRAAISALDAMGLVTKAFILAFSCLREETQAVASGF
jgi:hypothetical protein